jgi:hypothetical protein
MPFEPERRLPSLAGKPSSSSFAIRRGTEYLDHVRQLAPDPLMVRSFPHLQQHMLICAWIGENIDRINLQLKDCLQACHDCLHPQERRPMQIFAAPLAPVLGLDGFCNLQTTPVTLLIDVGRVYPEDWLAIVAHEYTHAHLGNSGHDATFATLLSHLCLGLGLDLPIWEPSMETKLRHWPPCPSRSDPLEFWRGEN